MTVLFFSSYGSYNWEQVCEELESEGFLPVLLLITEPQRSNLSTRESDLVSWAPPHDDESVGLNLIQESKDDCMGMAILHTLISRHLQMLALRAIKKKKNCVVSGFQDLVWVCGNLVLVSQEIGDG